MVNTRMMMTYDDGRTDTLAGMIVKRGNMPAINLKTFPNVQHHKYLTSMCVCVYCVCVYCVCVLCVCVLCETSSCPGCSGCVALYGVTG